MRNNKQALYESLMRKVSNVVRQNLNEAADNKVQTLYDNTYDNGYSYDEYLDWCNDMDEEPAEEDSRDYYDWVNEMLQQDWDDLESNLSDYEYDTFAIMGSCGLWDGRKEICPTIVTGLFEAIRKCCGECDYVKVTLDMTEGCVNVRASHHDGTNNFSIYKLNDDGIDYMEKCDEEGEDYEFTDEHFDKFTDYLF